ncbi:MAG: DUF1549 domain-containing protein, partial [Bacteroidetes bacterium]|nr:DUF1549 domain-containing protein [Bacteroidota bacterium]
KTYFSLYMRTKILGIALFPFLGIIVFWFIQSANQPVDFNAEIRPILNQKCITCHGGVKRSGGFSLLFRNEALSPNESGLPAIVPGNPDSSEMIARILHHDPELRMPLDTEPLSEEEIDLLTRWIKQGAKWEDHWAYVKPQSQSVPNLNDSWIENDIDRFILQRLKEEGLSPNREAEKETLVRRVSLDLVGLPPSPEIVADYLEDSSPEAYEKVVDKLLSSPQFGEKWASMWLDLARYADSKGYEKDAERIIWPYRDWVIKAFNRDLPFDEFTVEQLAGDMLPKSTEEQIIATGFHRNTMNNDEGGTDDEEFRTAAVIDRLNTTFDVWQGVSMSCVQCHSHPYDPFLQKEYYQLLAYFNNTEDADTPNEFPVLKGHSEEQKQQLAEVAQWISEHVEEKNIPEEASFKDLQKLVFLPKLYAGFCDDCHKVELRYAGNSQIAGYIETGSYLSFENVNLDQVESVTFNYVSGGAGGEAKLFIDKLESEPVISIPIMNTGMWAEGKDNK